MPDDLKSVIQNMRKDSIYEWGIMSTVPTTIVVLQALLTPAIAAGVGVIGYLQWRTAHQKVMLDLFDRRFTVIKEVEGAVNDALAIADDISGIEASRRIMRACSDSIYLFGSEVAHLIIEMDDDVTKYTRAVRRMNSAHHSVEEREAAAVQESELSSILIEKCATLKARCIPYLHMPQKRVRTPRELFQDLNEKRLSYADEKQTK
ncbi:hypothetical protein M8994_14425 [Brucella sp. 21LCYQ03]|nr:hypothetical protein [Brucella sp. 21LCYQ03]